MINLIIRIILKLNRMKIIYLSDYLYIKLMYRYKMGKKINLRNPQTFNEKIQWLKLYDRNSEYTKMVDKYEGKKYVSDMIGEEYIIPTLGIYEKFDDIDFEKLPNQFVLKCTHDSGGLIICKDKKDFNLKEARRKINKCLKTNYYYHCKEWPYKNVKPRIIVEKYMEDEKDKQLIDYKIMCFNGEPKLSFTCTDRFESELKVTFFDLKWNKLPFERHYPKSDKIIEKPQNYEKMIEFSRILCKNIPFVRVDWYEINGKLYFGELTFYPGSGMEEFSPEDWDLKMGNMLKIPEKKIKRSKKKVNNSNQIPKNIFSSIIQQIFTVIYGFIIPSLLIKRYGSQVNGLVSSITQFLSYIVLLEFGIGPIIKYSFFKPLMKKDTEEIEKILGTTNSFFKRIAYIFIVYLFLLCIIYPNFIEEFNHKFVISLIIIIFFGKFFEYFIGMTYKLFLQADGRNYVINYTVTLTYILNLIIILILLKLNASIQSVMLVSSASYIIRPLVLKAYFKLKYGYKFIKKSDYKLQQQWDGLFHHLASVVQSNTDVVILTLFSNLKNVSVYMVYNLVTNGIRVIIQSLTNGLDAFFGKMMVDNDKEIVKQKFEIYTFLFYTVTAILLSCTLVLIIPFISIYTKSMKDANYIQEMFAYLMVFAEMSYVIRYPFSDIVYAKGHFKQTRNFSIAEPIANIIISVALVIKMGLVGVAIGTLISMFIRTIGFIVYASRKILGVKLIYSFKKIIIVYIEMITVFTVHLLIGNQIINNYFDWFIYAIIVFVIITIFVLLVNSLVFKDISRNIFKRLKNVKEMW